jgi:hypothetical protein
LPIWRDSRESERLVVISGAAKGLGEAAAIWFRWESVLESSRDVPADGRAGGRQGVRPSSATSHLRLGGLGSLRPTWRARNRMAASPPLSTTRARLADVQALGVASWRQPDRPPSEDELGDEDGAVLVDA